MRRGPTIGRDVAEAVLHHRLIQRRSRWIAAIKQSVLVRENSLGKIKMHSTRRLAIESSDANEVVAHGCKESVVMVWQRNPMHAYLERVVSPRAVVLGQRLHRDIGSLRKYAEVVTEHLKLYLRGGPSYERKAQPPRW